jgi:aspartate-semialdehyde dehydrogenase
MSLGYDVAIVGATGVVGEVFLEILAERNFPVNQLYLLASERSAGERLAFKENYYKVENLAEFDFSKVQFAFFSAGGDVSAQYAPIAAEAGAVVIDNTSQFRYEPDVPLVVPEVNAHALAGFRERNIIANPNCSTAQMVVVLKPIHDIAGIARVNVATYQAVSGAGRKAIEELARQTANLLNGQEINSTCFPKQIAFNVLPQIDKFEENGYTREEMKMVWETKKILEDDNIMVNPTAVRVPVFYGHSEAVHIETLQPISAEEVKDILSQTPGITVVDDLNDYPTPITNAAAHDDVFVGRIRQDISHPQGIDLWIVADNVRKGAALNAVQIAEDLIKNDFYLTCH